MSLIDTTFQLPVDNQDAERATSLERRANHLPNDQEQGKDEKLWKVACGFEEIFINMMLQQMRKASSEGGLIGGGNDAKMYRDMFDSQVAEEMAENKGFGLSRIIYDYLKGSDPIQGKKDELQATQQYASMAEIDKKPENAGIPAVRKIDGQ